MAVIDLHTHSTASDGSLHPAELLETAAARGISALALTDHDTIAGLEEARNAAERLGVRFIPGVELEITWEPERGGIAPRGEFHLLGLGIREPGAVFHGALRDLAVTRERRNREMLLRLEEIGLRADYEELRRLVDGLPGHTGATSIGRPHIAELLVRKKLVKNHDQAFRRWLGKGRPYYVPKEGLRFRDACRIIRDAGGISVLAHPLSLYLSWGKLPVFVTELARQGLGGIEAWHPTVKPRDGRRLEQLGRDLGLAVTEGSDFHGLTRPDRRLGYSGRSRKIGDELLVRLGNI